jgi:hypothetical protein
LRPLLSEVFPLRGKKAGGLQSQGTKGAAVANLLQALGNTGSGVLRLFYQKGRACSAVASGAEKVAMSPSMTSKPVKSLRTQGA